MVTKKREDTAEGCRSLAGADRERAAGVTAAHMRASLERSAAAWTTRADLLERLEKAFSARASAYAEEQEQRRSEGNAHG